MNEFDPSETDLPTPAEKYVPTNAGSNLLIALGVGLAVGVLVHVLRPAPKPQQRLVRLLEDMEAHLREVSAPMLHKAGALAADGASLFGDRVHRGEAQIEKFLRTATRRLRRLAS